MNLSDNSNLYYYKFYGLNLQINKLLPEFEQNKRLDKLNVQVILDSTSLAEYKKLFGKKLD